MSAHEGIWIFAEQAGGRVLPVGHELLTRGRELADKRGCELTGVALGHRFDEGDLRGLIARGADRVIAMEAPQLEHFLIEPYSACLCELIRSRRPEIVIAGATSTGRTLMPYVAVRVDAGLTADCTMLDIDRATGELLQTRPAIGGNVMATIRTPRHRPQMATVRPHSTRPAEADGERLRARMSRERESAGNPLIERVAVPPELLSSRVRRVGFVGERDEHALQDAELVVCAGRGVKKAENLELVRKLAEAIGASLGATRDVVDRGWLSYPHQIGLSGKTVTPRLYVGVGVSGSIQHLAGMQTAETIVAVNSDPEAQIFLVADFGIVGDLFEVVPVLTSKLLAARKSSVG